MPVPGSEAFPGKVGSVLIEIRVQSKSKNSAVNCVLPNNQIRIALQNRVDSNPSTSFLIATALIVIPTNNFDVNGKAQIRLFRLSGNDITQIRFIGFWVL